MFWDPNNSTAPIQITRTHHNLFPKQNLETLLETVGQVTSSRKIVSETHETDSTGGNQRGAIRFLAIIGCK
jgi:hypothetical protein